MLDLLIRDARVVDGTGAPAYSADIGVIGGRIARIGALREPARRTIDAGGKVLAPGFVDIHTHYDAQAFWDPAITPSCLHGVTTVLAGNCGFSIAPLTKEAAPYLLRMLARVEGMPEASLEAGVPWDWQSFGDYLDRLDGRVGVNMGFMCGHSALRRVAMGERAVEAEATDEELERMKALLADLLSAGAMGFSSTRSPTHNDAEGRPVPSRHASRAEFLALARVVRDHPGTILEFLPGVGRFSDEDVRLMTEMSLAAQRSLNWNALVPMPGNEEQVEAQLSASDRARAAGAEVVALSMASSPTVRINLHSGMLFDTLPGWAEVFQLPIPERIALFRDPQQRQRLAAAADAPGAIASVGRWERYTIAFSEDKSLVGRNVGDIARSQGKAPFDVLLDAAIGDELKTVFQSPVAVDDDTVWARRRTLWRDDRVVIGASDAGAHLDMIDAFAITTSLLAAGRDRVGFGVEESVRLLTQVPASLMGLTDRGTIAEGLRADLVVFDPDTVAPGPTTMRRDLPGDEMRLFAEAEGISHVIVDGVPIVEGKDHTGALPGHVLRSGRDTHTRWPVRHPAAKVA